MNAKRISVILGALLLICLLAVLATPPRIRYRADSIVLAMPSTNALFARSFESQVIRAMPSVLSLRVMPARIVPSPALMFTNGATIDLIAIGSTAGDADNAANEAARSLCRMLATNYGVSCQVVQQAYGTRKYSYFHDSLQPTIGRWFRR
jgi:hypothetical protein